MSYFCLFSDTKNSESHIAKKQEMDHYDSINDVNMEIEVLKSVDPPKAL